MARAAMALIAAFQCGALAGCSGLAATIEDVPTIGPDPGYNKLVASYLNSQFKNRSAYDAFEISDYRWVHTVKGWTWLTCVRFQDHGHIRVYAVFVKDIAVVDGRYAVLTDNCGAPAYVPFDAMMGAGMTGPGALAPLH